jgi:hypothetical protein
VLDAAEQSLQEATPVPPPTEGALAVQDAVAGAQPPAEEAPANASVPQEQPTGFTVRNRFNLLPSRVNFQAAQQPKTDVEQKYDAGLMFQVLGGDSAELKIIADELLGR